SSSALLEQHITTTTTHPSLVSRMREAYDHRGPHAQNALHANLAPVLLHDRFGAGQADTRTGHVPCRGGAIKEAEDMRHLVVRDAHAPVAHGKDGSLLRRTHLDPHRRTIRAVLDSIADDAL